MRACLSVSLILLAAACARPPVAPPAREPEPARARAALASLRVDNRTGERITVLYRLTTRRDVEVVVGQVPAQSFIQIAPVPAGEPLVLVARTAAGAELTLPARAFPLDAEWTWLIPADTRFIIPPERAP
jgi:hypothetical protein